MLFLGVYFFLSPLDPLIRTTKKQDSVVTATTANSYTTEATTKVAGSSKENGIGDKCASDQLEIFELQCAMMCH